MTDVELIKLLEWFVGLLLTGFGAGILWIWQAHHEKIKGLDSMITSTKAELEEKIIKHSSDCVDRVSSINKDLAKEYVRNERFESVVTDFRSTVNNLGNSLGTKIDKIYEIMLNGK